MAVGYHAITFGPLIGEVIRRISGKTLGKFFADEVAGPLGVDFHIGTPPEKDAQVTDLVQSLPFLSPTGTNSIPDRVFFNPYVRPQDSFTIPWRRGELGGSNGHGNARSVAAAQSVLSAGGSVRGVTLLSRAGCERALEPQFDGVDLVAGYPLRWGLGYGLESPALVGIYGPHVKGKRIACWGGSGGSFVMNDFDRRMTVAYVMNKHVEHGGLDHRGVDVIRAAYESLFGPSADEANRTAIPTFLVGKKS
jgi:CubicO group peptidase (beta-lactamase class C family)